MTQATSKQLEAVNTLIDEANAQDPRTTVVDGKSLPFETVYADRMIKTLNELYPDASELLRIAARAQHIRRWEIPRDQYPMNREGYQNWRLTLRKMHSDLVGAIMADNGYTAEDIARVGTFLRKEQLKKDTDSQALENVVDVVFLGHYWDDFVTKFSDYDDDKLIDIVGKTLLKMSTKGHQAALALDLPESTTRIVLAAIEREKGKLAILAKRELE